MGATWQADGPPGRDLRSPEQRPGYRSWPFADGDTPGSNQLDAALAGADYEKPVERPVLKRSASSLHPTGSAAPWIHNPPSSGRVHRTGGSAQLRRAPALPGDSAVEQLGADFFMPDGPADAPGPVCEYEPCQKTLTPGPPGGMPKRFCCAQHRVRASEQRKKEAQPN